MQDDPPKDSLTELVAGLQRIEAHLTGEALEGQLRIIRQATNKQLTDHLAQTARIFELVATIAHASEQEMDVGEESSCRKAQRALFT